ncbi:MAG: hypothetical protein HDR26_08955 [Lachnospiraceae bacterium]|nr:hypothetical protein [Lachnospiraceae bacterium]
MKMVKKIYQNVDKLLFAAAILIGISLCLTKNLTYDEYYSFALAKHNLLDIITITSNDVHPPAYYIGLHFFLALFPYQQAAKIFSLLFYIGYLALVQFGFKEYLSKEENTFFLFLSVFFPCMFIHGCNVRMYSFAMFWTLAAALLAVNFCRKDNSVGRNCLLIVCSLLAMYSHLFTMLGVFFLYLLILIYVIAKREIRRILHFGVIGIFTACGYLPWLSITFQQATTHKNLIAPYDEDTFWVIVSEWFSSWHTPSRNSIHIGLFVTCLLCIIGIFSCIRKKIFLPMAGILPFFMVVITGVTMSILYEPCFFGRYAYAFIWGILVLMSCGYARLFKIGKIITIILVFAMFFINYRDELQMEFENEQDVFEEFASENIGDEDLIILSTVHGVLFETTSTRFLFGPVPAFSPFENLDTLLYKEQLLPFKDKTIWWIGFDKFVPTFWGHEAECMLELTYQKIEFSVWRVSYWGP